MYAYKRTKRMDEGWLRGPAEPPLAEWIAARVADAIAGGELGDDDRLPPQRVVAKKLGIDLTTVTRGYRLAQSRGLIVGQPGRGTFVRARARSRSINLAVNLPPPLPPALASEALQVAANITRHRSSTLLDYRAVPEAATDAAVEWLRRCRMEASRDQVLITSGAQHALSTIAAVLRTEHSSVLVEELTYAAFRDIATLFGLALHPVKMDAGGIIPAAVEREARRHRATAIYVTPSMHNPTGITMSERRRDELAAAVASARLLLIEDDIYGPIVPRPGLPLAMRIPERTIYLTSLSKCVAPGLRVGYIVASSDRVARLHQALRALILTTASIGADVASAWIQTGLADRILATRRDAMLRRHRLARALLAPAFDVPAPPSFHLWLRLRMAEDEFVEAALAAGVAVNPGRDFAVAPGPPAVRACIAAPSDDAELREAAGILTRIASRGTRPPSRF